MIREPQVARAGMADRYTFTSLRSPPCVAKGVRVVIRLFVIACLSFFVMPFPTASLASPPADQLLPTTTKGFVSVPDVDDFRKRWDNMQLGKLSADPIMKPFADDLQRQFRDRIINSRFHVAVSWDQLAEACGGEFCVASVQPDNDPEKHAAVMIVDVQGRQQQAQNVIKDISDQLLKKGAKRSVVKAGDHELVIHDLPREKGQIQANRVIRFLVDDTLVVSNDEPVCRQVLKHLVDGNSADTLHTLKSFVEVMDRVSAEAGNTPPQIRWYIDPFDYAQVVRAAQGGRKKRGKDMLSILRTQGFDAVQAIGGYVHMATGQHEMLHRTMVYAPPVEESGSERYRLAARMLNFPNDTQWNWQNWLPRELASATSFRWKAQDAFRYSKTLVDAIAGSEGFFDDLLSSIKDDPNGPQIDVQKEFVSYLGENVTVMSDHMFPITPKSERLLVAVALTDPEAVRKTVHKALNNDPDARPIDVGDHTIWEIIDQEDESAPDLELELEGIDPIGDTEVYDDVAEDENLLRNSAITVAHGQLMVATHVDCLRRILESRPATDQLNHCEDFRLVEKHLREIGANSDCVRFFTRTDEAYGPTYELIRQGRMPESESMLGKLLNRMLGPDEDGVLRDQQIDGSQLPEYQAVRRYLGPSGTFVRSEDNGWFASGCLLDKQAAYVDGVEQPAITAQLEEEEPSKTH